jgi:hypothetical protein
MLHRYISYVCAPDTVDSLNLYIPKLIWLYFIPKVCLARVRPILIANNLVYRINRAMYLYSPHYSRIHIQLRHAGITKIGILHLLLVNQAHPATGSALSLLALFKKKLERGTLAILHRHYTN